MEGHKRQAISSLHKYKKLEWVYSSKFRAEVTFQLILNNISLRETCLDYASATFKRELPYDLSIFKIF